MTAAVSANPICAVPAATCFTASADPCPRTICIEVLPGIVALFQRDKVVRVTTVVAEVGDEGDFIRRASVSPAHNRCADHRRYHNRNANLSAITHWYSPGGFA